MQAVTVVARGLLVGHLLGAQLIQTFGSAEAAEGVARADQQLAVYQVDLAALALAVGAMGTAKIRALVPMQPQPAQGVEDQLFRFGAGAHLVGVLDTQDELTAVLASEALIEQSNVGGAYVGVSGR